MSKLGSLLDFSGKTALITGGGKGAGIAIARQFAMAGANVAITYSRSAAGAEATVEELKGLGVDACAFQLDQMDTERIPRVLDEVKERFGSLDDLRLYKLLYSPSRIEGATVDLDLADLYLNGEQIPGTVDPRTTPPEQLTTGYLSDIPGGEGAYVSAIGMNCGYFAVQYRYPSVDKECYMGAYLLDGNGQRIDSIPGGTSTLDDGDGMATTERYFKVDAETLENCTLCFEGSIYDVAHGDWEIDIDFESTQGVRLLTADIEFDGVTARDTEMILSPIGLELTREYDAGSHMLDTDVVLETTSGDIKLRSCGSEWASTDMSTWNTFFEAHEPIDVSSVTAIRIGDTRLELE